MISTLIVPSAFAATHQEHTSADGVNTRVVSVAADTQALTHKSSFLKLPPDIINIIIGYVAKSSPSGSNMSADDIVRSISNGERFHGEVSLGFLTVDGMAALRRVNRAFNNQIKPMFCFLRWLFVNQKALERPQQELTVSEMVLIQSFLKGKDPMLDSGGRVNADEHMNVAVRFLNLNMVDTADVMFGRIITHGTAADILSAARKLLKLGSECQEEAACVYKAIENYSTEDVGFLRSAARSLVMLGLEYHKRAARMHGAIVTHPTATAARQHLANPGPYYTDGARRLGGIAPRRTGHSITDAALELANI